MIILKYYIEIYLIPTGRTQQELKEVYAFNLCSDMRLATNFCKYGMKAGNAYSGNHLGDCNMGVYFYRSVVASISLFLYN